MTKGPHVSVLIGRGVMLVPVAAEHVPALLLIRRTPAVLARWGDPDGDPDWPFDEPETVCFAVLVDGEVRGLRRDAVRTLARHLIDDRGHHRLVIDPAADNEAAIRAYEAVGFRRVGVMRAYERDVDGTRWHDGLLMELLAGELRD